MSNVVHFCIVCIIQLSSTEAFVGGHCQQVCLIGTTPQHGLKSVAVHMGIFLCGQFTIFTGH